MTRSLAPVTALLFGTALLLMGNGLQGTLIPVRAGLEGFSTTDIGLIGTAYFLGFALGCVLGPRAVKRAGHIRTFAAMAATASALALVHALIVSPPLWGLLRAVIGFCFATLYVVIESWLNERATNETRGTILSIYTIINLTVMTVGQMMMTLYDPQGFPLFALASILVSLAAVPIALTAAPAPAPVTVIRIRLGYIYGVSPVGSLGALAVGLTNGAFWSLGPLFAQNAGLKTAAIAAFMSTAVIGGAIGQWPLGRVSDSIDRRIVIAAACLIGVLAGIGMIIFNDIWQWGMLSFAFAYGFGAFPLYAVCVAHTNDHITSEDFVEASSVLLLLYAAGAAIGPLPASYVMEVFGDDALFGYTAGAHILMLLFAAYRIAVRSAIPYEDKRDFVNVTRTSATVYELDPRAEDDDETHGTHGGENGEQTQDPASSRDRTAGATEAGAERP